MYIQGDETFENNSYVDDVNRCLLKWIIMIKYTTLSGLGLQHVSLSMVIMLSKCQHHAFEYYISYLELYFRHITAHQER